VLDAIAGHAAPTAPLDSAARVSVIIPVQNGVAYLGDALGSVLAQRRPAQEIIVVDDGSSDGSEELARSFPGVRCLRQESAGQASALNAGVTASTGDFLAFLDADDRWLPDKLQLQLAAFSSEPELEIVFGHARQFFEPGVTSTRLGESPALPARLPSALLVRRAAWQRVGAFSSEWPLGGVIEWCARAEDCGLRSRMLDELVYERRVHGKNATLSHPDAAREYARMLKGVLDRRRGRFDPDPPAAIASGPHSGPGRGGAA
jgi:glycosyltransferase involved in cell wall biosynthesis